MLAIGKVLHENADLEKGVFFKRRLEDLLHDHKDEECDRIMKAAKYAIDYFKAEVEKAEGLKSNVVVASALPPTEVVAPAVEEPARKREKEHDPIEFATKKRKNKEAENVCVCLTGLSGFENYQFCHMDGHVVEEAKDGGQVTVEFPLLQKRASVERDRISSVRGAADSTVRWKKNDAVHVFHANGWWEATIVGAAGKKKWKVKWTGQYNDCEDEELVDAKDLRSASFIDPK